MTKVETVKDLIIANLILLKKEAVPFKRKYYESSLNAIHSMTEDEILERKTFVDIKGIGNKISEKIIYIRDNKKNLDEVDISIQQDQGFDIGLIYGIGPVAKRRIIDQYGSIRDISHLKEIDTEYNILTTCQKKGAQYFSDIQQSIPRPEMIAHDDYLTEHMNSSHGDTSYNISGSYRRGSESSGDIDVLIHCNKSSDMNKSFKTFVTSLKEAGYIVEDLAFGERKYMGLCRLPGSEIARRIDIMITSKEEYFFALLYFTGDDNFNKEMRSHALEKGYSLNEKRITNSATKEHVVGDFDSEESIFDFFNFEYVPPTQRKSGALSQKEKK